MGADDWETGYARSVGVFLNGEAITDRDRRGQRITDQSFLLLFDAHHEPIDWVLPKQWGDHWQVSSDTTDPAREGKTTQAGVPFPVASHSVVVLGQAEALS